METVGVKSPVVMVVVLTTKSLRYPEWMQLERRLMSEIVGVGREIHIPQMTVGPSCNVLKTRDSQVSEGEGGALIPSLRLTIGFRRDLQLAGGRA